MIYYLICIALAFASIVDCNTSKIPGVTNCLSTLPQSAFDECILKQARNFLPTFAKGLPALNVPPSDPLYIDHVSMPASNLAFDIYNATLRGTHAANIEHFHLDLKRGKTKITFNADFKLNGKYTLNGQLIKAIPITGAGNVTIDIKNIRIVLVVNFIRVKHMNGDRHFKLTNYTSEYEVLDKAVFSLTNLFDGKNDLLAETAVAVLNEDWKDMIDNVAKPAIHEVIEKTIGIVGKFFDSVTMIELYPEMANSGWQL